MKVFNLNTHTGEHATIVGPVQFRVGEDGLTDPITLEGGEQYRIDTTTMQPIEHAAIALHVSSGTRIGLAWLAMPGDKEELHRRGLRIVQSMLNSKIVDDVGTLLRYLPTVEDQPVLFVASPERLNLPPDVRKATHHALVAYFSWKLSEMTAR